MKNFLPRLFQGKDIRSADIEEIKATEEYQSLESRNQLTVEEEAQLKRYLQNINPDDKNSPYAPENVEPPDYGSITFWDKREVIVSNKDVRPDGLAMPATKTLSLMYALTIEDAVVFVDPNTDLDEKVIAGLFLIPTPAKFGKPFLKRADDLGGAVNVGRKGKKYGDLLNSKGIDNPKTRLPRKNGKWYGEPGNGKWYSDKHEVKSVTNGKGIEFIDGRPNFTPWSKGSIKFKEGMLVGSKNDFSLVYEKIMQLKGFKSQNQAKYWLKEKGLTPHHKSSTEIELIPTNVHANIPHIGSASDLRGGK